MIIMMMIVTGRATQKEKPNVSGKRNTLEILCKVSSSSQSFPAPLRSKNNIYIYIYIYIMTSKSNNYIYKRWPCQAKQERLRSSNVFKVVSYS